MYIIHIRMYIIRIILNVFRFVRTDEVRTDYYILAGKFHKSEREMRIECALVVLV